MLKIIVLVLGFFCVSITGTAFSATLSHAQQLWIGRIEKNLADTHSFQAKFQQIAPDGKASTGTVILVRPGRVRFNYDPPSPLLLVANDDKVVFQDRSIDQVTTLPLRRTPLGLLLRPDPRFSGDVTVTSFRESAGEIQISVVRTQTPDEGELTMFFAREPFAFLGWTVRDAQGAVTQIRLSDVQTNIVVAADLFTLPKAE